MFVFETDLLIKDSAMHDPLWMQMLMSKPVKRKSFRWVFLLLILLLILSNLLYWSTKVGLILEPYSMESQSPVGPLWTIQPPVGPPWTIFYNVYLPMQGELPALGIVQEQLEQIEQSFAASFGRVTIYITTIGKPIDQEYFSRHLCATKSLDCRFLGHHETGFEEFSLTALHEFCTSTSTSLHPSHKVIYVHNKGSLHPSEAQNRWRRHLTQAVTSEQCLNHNASTQACDVCGLLALPWPFLHMTGNFFAAQCTYIRKLLAPFEYHDRNLNVTITALLRKAMTYQFTSDLLNDGANHFGVYRFANEHWIGSHPTVQACDLTPHDFYYWRRAEHPAEYELASFPRRGILDGWSFVDTKRIEGILNNKRHRMREYYLLPGNIHRWLHVYGVVPPSTSWVWTWFPDGAEWQAAVQSYGMDAVNRVTMKYAPGSELRCLPPCSEPSLF